MRNDVDRRRPRPELHQLAVFLQVVEAGSFSGAARRLGCSQPAVSQTISRLEDVYGGDLFARRRGAPLALTPIGKAVLPSVCQILNAVDRQMADATSTARSCGGILSVGFCPGLFEGRLRLGMAAFAAEASLVRLRLVEGAPKMLSAALDRYQLDVMVSPLSGMPDSAEHESEFLWNERFVTAIPQKGPLACRKEVSGPALCAVTLLWSRFVDGNEHGRTPTVAATERGDDPHHELSPATVLDLVAMGLGTGIVPASAANPRSGVDFQPIDDDNAHIAIHARWLRDDANPLRHRLLRHFRAAANRELG